MLDYYNLTLTCYGALIASVLKLNCLSTKMNASTPTLTPTPGTYNYFTTMAPAEQENPNAYCDNGVRIGENCGEDPNFVCQRNAFRAQCQCIDGFIEDKISWGKCICPNTMTVNTGKCSCKNGHKKTSDGQCIEPVKSCPWGQRIQCYIGTGQADGNDCIPSCECIEGSLADGTCSYKGITSQEAENSCIVKGRDTSFELKQINSKCDFDKNYLCNRKDNDWPRCECSNGFELQMMGNSVACSCFSPKITHEGKCECPNGQVFKNGSCIQEKLETNRDELQAINGQDRLNRMPTMLRSYDYRAGRP